MKQRIRYIDLMKGICIILVVLNHGDALNMMEGANGLVSVLEMGRMALFFFLSGLFFRSYGCFGDFATRKFCQHIVPMFVFGLLSGVIVDCVPWTGESYGLVSSLERWKLYIFRCPNAPAWFLRALFLSSLVMYGACALCRRSKWRTAFVSMGLAGFSYAIFYGFSDTPFLEARILHHWLGPLVKGLALLPFLWMGCLAGRAGMLDVPRTRKNIIAAAAIAVGAVALSCIIPIHYTSWYLMRFDGPWFYTIAVSVLSIVLVWSVAFVLEYVPYVSYLGRYSIVVLCTHFIVMKMLWKHTGLFGWPVALIALAFSSVSIYACVRWLPWACAQKQLLEWRDGRVHLAAWLRKNQAKEAARA